MENVKPELSHEEKTKLELNVAKSVAVRQAMLEVMAEHRGEIIRRARAKLTGMGIILSDKEVEGL